jgi:integrase/recombinase XerD
MSSIDNEALLYKFETYLLTEKRVSINTLAAYKRDLKQFVTFFNTKKIAIAAIESSDLKKFLAYMHKMKLSARSIARKISALKTFYAYVHQHFEWKNIAQELRIPKMPQTLPQYLSEDEIKALFTAADSDTSPYGLRNKVMLYLLYTSGMRISELVKLRIANIHFDTGFICVVGKGGKERMVPIPHMVLALLQKYIDTTLATKQEKRKARNTVSYIFPTQYGGKIKPMSRQSFWIILNSIWKKTGIKKIISPHQLRHSLATHMLQQGLDLRSLQIVLGHENLTTVQIYTHVETSYLRKIYDNKHPRS